MELFNTFFYFVQVMLIKFQPQIKLLVSDWQQLQTDNSIAPMNLGKIHNIKKFNHLILFFRVLQGFPLTHFFCRVVSFQNWDYGLCSKFFNRTGPSELCYNISFSNDIVRRGVKTLTFQWQPPPHFGLPAPFSRHNFQVTLNFMVICVCIYIYIYIYIYTWCVCVCVCVWGYILKKSYSR